MIHINNIQISNNFNLREFECPCCHRVIIHEKLLRLLVKLRKKIKHPLYINSGYRCKEENIRVGGVPNSYHRMGYAADIRTDHINPIDLVALAMGVGFIGIGLYRTFLHVDIRPNEHFWEG